MNEARRPTVRDALPSVAPHARPQSTDLLTCGRGYHVIKLSRATGGFKGSSGDCRCVSCRVCVLRNDVCTCPAAAQSLNCYILSRVNGLGACRSHVEAVYPAFRVTDSQRSIT